MQPVTEGPHDTAYPIGGVEDGGTPPLDAWDVEQARLKAFAKKYHSKAKEFVEADIKGGLWLDDNGNFYSLLVPIDIDTTFFKTPDIIGALARDPDSPALDENPIHLSKREFAAITMRVPQSGIEWLDDMIREANRRSAAVAALNAVITHWCEADPRHANKTGEVAAIFADALTAALARDAKEG